MPKWKPAPESAVRTFYDAVEELEGVEVRKMFGYPAAFANGNMFAGLFQESFVLKLPDSLHRDFVEKHGAQPFAPMPGRVMREYAVASRDVVRSPVLLGTWLGHALSYVRTLPPKASAAKKAAAGKKKR